MQSMVELRLSGPRGDNPLGFLTVLGVVAVLEDASVGAAVRWDGLTAWIRFQLPANQAGSANLDPCDGVTCQVRHEAVGTEGALLLGILTPVVRRSRPAEEAAKRLEQARKMQKQRAKQIKDREEEIKKRDLSRTAIREALNRELTPLRSQLDQARRAYREVLMEVGIDPVLTLGENLTATNAEFQQFLEHNLTSARRGDSRVLSMAASYGICDPNRPDEDMRATPWAVTSGAGHQHFLETARELMLECTPCHLARALFGPWIPSDEKLSLRWDPIEDRRYALMASDPTSSENKTLTLWGANRLAFEALRFFPAYPCGRGMAVLAWRPSSPDNWRVDVSVRWPLWKPWLSARQIQSVLALPGIWEDSPVSRAALTARGIQAVIHCTRIQTDKRYNLLPGTPIWMV